MLPVLLDRIELSGAIVTADAMHAQREHARYLVAQRGAHYILTIKGNQPSLHDQLKALPWRDVPVTSDTRGRGHGRHERRTLKVTAVAAGLAFPYAAQAIQIVRRRRPSPTQEVVHRDGIRHYLAHPGPGQPRSSWPPPSAATGPSRTACTGSAT